MAKIRFNELVGEKVHVDLRRRVNKNGVFRRRGSWDDVHEWVMVDECVESPGERMVQLKREGAKVTIHNNPQLDRDAEGNPDGFSLPEEWCLVKAPRPPDLYIQKKYHIVPLRDITGPVDPTVRVT